MGWQLHSNMVREVAQTLQEARKMARSLENTALSLVPLADGDDRHDLSNIAMGMGQVSHQLTKMYNDLAPKAFGPESKP